MAKDETTTDRTVDELHAIFAWWGIPLQMVTDNGPQFTSAGFERFLALNNIQMHFKCSPYHPATNGLVECFIQTLKQALKVLKRDGHTAAQPGQLLIELSERKTFYNRSHTGNIDDGEGSTMQTQSPDDRLSVDRRC